MITVGKNKILLFIVGVLLLTPLFTFVCRPEIAAASDSEVDSLFWGGEQSEVDNAIGLEKDKDPREIAAEVIKIILGFLGIIAVIIILVAGFKWMTAAGNEEKINEAKKLITAAIIGLLIILAAFGIATFVIDNLLEATDGKS